MNELAPGLLRYCRARLRGADSARDVAQSALTALVDRWRRLGPPESPAAFVFAIARRRASAVAFREAIHLPLTALGLQAEPFHDPTRAIESRDAIQRVRDAIGRLTRPEREAFLLVVAGELSIAEAALALSVGESALKMRLARARKRLAGDVR